MKSRYTLLLLLSFIVFSCNQAVQATPDNVAFSLNNVEGSIHTEDQTNFINTSTADRQSMISGMGTLSKSKPNAINISWDVEADKNVKASSYKVTISENDNLNNPLVYKVKNKDIDIYNLKINTKYYYQVEAIYSSKTFTSDISDFTINDNTPRNLYVDGVENVRDCGGWNIGENRIYKQGMLFRTAQFNYGGDNTYVSAPSKEGIKSLKNELHVKTEIDLRKTIDSFNDDEVNSITSSPLGSDVNYVSTPMVFGGSNIFTNAKNKESIKTFFETLAVESNYPIAFHCLRGTDRTGALAYAIGALVGMNKEDLYLDYEFSNLAKIGGSVATSGQFDSATFYEYGIDNSEGSTLSEKAKNYLISKIGVSETTLNSIIDILTDEVL